MSDALYHGRRFRTLNVLDEGVREALDIVIDTSIPGGRLVRTLEQLSRWRGLPQVIRCDNGPELLSQAFVDWCEENSVEIRYIQPGKPNQNAYIERFNRTYRGEVLDVYAFSDLDEVRDESTRWLHDYNHDRPHLALDRQTPAGYLARHESTVRAAEPSSRGFAPPSGLSSSTSPMNPQTLYF